MLEDSAAYPLSTDSVLLADFAASAGAKRALDLGCGSGVLGLIMTHANAALTVDGVEIDPAAAEEARRNAAESGVGERMRIFTADLRTLREADLGGRYDLVVSNPPYFPVAGGTRAATDARSRARSEETCTLAELARAAAAHLKYGGKFFLVYRTERLAEAFCTLSAAKLEPKRLRLVQSRADCAPSATLIECRLGGKPGLKVEPTLILKNADGTDTAETRRIYRLDL